MAEVTHKRSSSIGLAWLCVAMAACYFFLRVFLSSTDQPLSDLAAPYVSTILWLHGANPYNVHLFLPAWFASGAAWYAVPETVSGTHSVYPPTAFPLFALFGWLHWPGIVLLFLVVGIALYGLTVYGLIRAGWPGISWRQFAQDPRAVFFLAFSLGFAPVHTALRSRNIVLIASCLAILGILVLLKGRESRLRSWLAGIAVAVSICLKPTTGIFVIFWLVRQRKIRALGWVILICVLLSLTGLIPMILNHGMVWLTSYRANVDTLFTHGGNASVYPENTGRTDRIDLQLALFALTSNKSLSSILPVLVYGGLLGSFLWSAGLSNTDRRSPSADANEYDGALLTAAGSLALGLLPVYSRVYSAVVLLPLVLWCFRQLHLKSAKWLLFLLSDFLLNTSAVLRHPEKLVAIASRNQNLWDGTIGGHTCWLLLLMGILLVWAAREQRQAMRDETAPHAMLQAVGHTAQA
jgi:hypothetical protein